MKRILLLIILLAGFVIKAQPPTKFYTAFGGPGIDIGYGVKQTLDRNYIVVGSTSSYGAGNTDVYLVKVDSMGVVTWGKTFGGFGNDVGRSIIQLNDSGYVITGFTNSYGAGGYDAYLIRTDKLGNLIWQKAWGGLDWDFAYDLVQAADGNIVICGNTQSYGNGKVDGMVAKFDVNGTLVWQKFYGGVEDDEFRGLYTNNGTEFLAAGNTKSFGDLNGDMLCYKVDNNGDSLLRIAYGGPLYDGANDVIINPVNEIILVGGSNSFTNGQMDAFFAKFSSTGTFMAKRFHGLSGKDEQFYKITKSQTYDLKETVAMFTTDEIPSYKIDLKTIFMDGIGDWFGGYMSGSFGTTADDESYDICGTFDKGYVHVGYTTLNSLKDKDIFLVKMDSLLNGGSYVVGIKELNQKNNNNIQVYPNPISGDQELNIRHNLFSMELEVFNIAGNLIYKEEKKINPNEIRSVVFKDFPAGLYILKLKDKEQSYYSKILKQ